MNIRDRRQIRLTASQALSSAPGNSRMVAYVYAGIICLLSLAASLLSYYLNTEIAGTGGLSNMGLRSTLSTISALLPIIQLLITLGLELGYASVMLDTARGRGADARNLAEGFYRFGPMLRAALLQVLICVAIVFVAMYLSIWIFMLLPASDAFYDLAQPILESMTALDATLSVDGETLAALNTALIPWYCIMGVVCCVVLIPILYQFRMVTFCIADADHPRAMAALRESRQMMRGNRLALFRLDLNFWWYYLLQVLVTVVCYGDVLLPMLGVALPWSETVSYFLFLILSLVLQAVVFCCFMNKVTVTYATAYDVLRPKPQSGGVALGNIFDM